MSEQQDGAEGPPSGARKAHESIPALHPGVPWRDPKKCFRILLLSSQARLAQTSFQSEQS